LSLRGPRPALIATGTDLAPPAPSRVSTLQYVLIFYTDWPQERGTKRKVSDDDDDDSDSDDTDPFEDLDLKTCQKLVQIFKAATNRKKHKKGTSSKSA
jgi:hypothetical protein